MGAAADGARAKENRRSYANETAGPWVPEAQVRSGKGGVGERNKGGRTKERGKWIIGQRMREKEHRNLLRHHTMHHFPTPNLNPNENTHHSSPPPTNCTRTGKR